MSLSQQVSWPPAGPAALLLFVISVVSLFPSLTVRRLLINLAGIDKTENSDVSSEDTHCSSLTELQPGYQDVFLSWASKNDCRQVRQVGKNNCNVLLSLLLVKEKARLSMSYTFPVLSSLGSTVPPAPMSSLARSLCLAGSVRASLAVCLCLEQWLCFMDLPKGVLTPTSSLLSCILYNQQHVVNAIPKQNRGCVSK